MGRVGSGKSSLLSSIIGDLTPVTTPVGTLVGSISGYRTTSKSSSSTTTTTIRRRGGEVWVKGSVALVSQTPFIVNATLRGNITFGKDMDDDGQFYRKVLQACALLPDLAQLPGACIYF